MDQPPGTLPAFAKDVPAAERFLGSKPAPAATPKGENICGPGTAVGPCTPTLHKEEVAPVPVEVQAAPEPRTAEQAEVSPAPENICAPNATVGPCRKAGGEKEPWVPFTPVPTPKPAKRKCSCHKHKPRPPPPPAVQDEPEEEEEVSSLNPNPNPNP